MQNSPKILLTGATGYVGGRLLQRLKERGESVRCLVRRPEFSREDVGSSTEVAQGDVLDPSSLHKALEGVETAYYLVHSLGSKKDFEETDRLGAENFAEAARACNLKRIVYLGGLGPDDASLSPHLRSRHEVGRILRASGIPTVEIRSSIVIGSGSLSFELIRSLVDRLPVMVTPRWVSVKAQPIYVEDLLGCLIEAMEVPLSESRIIEVGGEDVVSYRELMREYARQVGLKRIMIPVPVLTPWLSSLWLGLVTPIYARVGRKLIDSIRHATLVTDNSAREVFHFRPRGYKEAIEEALKEESRWFFRRWSDALSAGGTYKQWGGVKFGRRLVDNRTIVVKQPPEVAFRFIQRIGGRNGWYFGNILWRLRGGLDLLVGGVGMRRGRPRTETLQVGDPVDFWRVEALEPNRYLRFLAEMKLPGRAWLEFEVTPANGGSEIRQTAIFDPVGLFGSIYWYALYPVHHFVFAGMLRNLARRVEEGRERVTIPESER